MAIHNNDLSTAELRRAALAAMPKCEISWHRGEQLLRAGKAQRHVIVSRKMKGLVLDGRPTSRLYQEVIVPNDAGLLPVSECYRVDQWRVRLRELQVQGQATTEDLLQQVPVGSLWRRGSSTCRVKGHRDQVVEFFDVESGASDSGRVSDFIGPEASKKRVNLKVIDYSQVISVGSIWRNGSHKYRIIEIDEVADFVRYRGAMKNRGKFGSGIFGWDHEERLHAFIGPDAKMKLVAPLPSSKLARECAG